MKVDKEKLKQNIENWELYHLGLKHQSGAFIIVRNLRLTKKMAKCDVLVYHGEDGYMERYNDMEYPMEKII
jgi:hypothetical protein